MLSLGDLYKPEHYAARGAMSAAEVRCNVLTFTYYVCVIGEWLVGFGVGVDVCRSC